MIKGPFLLLADKLMACPCSHQEINYNTANEFPNQYCQKCASRLGVDAGVNIVVNAKDMDTKFLADFVHRSGLLANLVTYHFHWRIHEILEHKDCIKILRVCSMLDDRLVITSRMVHHGQSLYLALKELRKENAVFRVELTTTACDFNWPAVLGRILLLQKRGYDVCVLNDESDSCVTNELRSQLLKYGERL